jgi:hypothetical protein
VNSHHTGGIRRGVSERGEICALYAEFRVISIVLRTPRRCRSPHLPPAAP